MDYGKKDKKPSGLGNFDYQPAPNKLLEIKIQTGLEPMEKSGSGQEEARRIIEMLRQKKREKFAMSMPFDKDTQSLLPDVQQALLKDLISAISSDPFGVAAAEATDPSKKALYQGKDRMRMPEDIPEFLDFKKKGGM